MTTRRSPTLRLRRLRALLKRYRVQKFPTVAEVEKRLDWPHAKLSKIERGATRRLARRDMVDLLDLYEVTDPAQREEIFTLVKESREEAWWDPWRKRMELPDSYTAYISLETEASGLLWYEPWLVPGLLQTEDYARAVIRGTLPEISDAELEQRIELRNERQKLLTGPSPLRLWAILDEACLHRAVGGRDVMVGQLQNIVELAHDMPHVIIQVLPFSAGAHSGINAFEVLEFPDELDLDAVYQETNAGGLMVENSADVIAFRKAFQHLQSLALSERDSLAMIAARAAQM